MNVLIAEDELLAAERLKELLHQCHPEANVVAQADTVAEAVSFFRSGGKADLLLLDIQLADGKSFEIFEKVEVGAPVIFITAYDQYAIHAFDFLSIAYVLKPLQLEDLRKGLDKFKQLTGYTGLRREEIDLIRGFLTRSAHRYKERFLIKSGSKLLYRSASEVDFFVAQGKEVYMMTKGENRKYLVDHTLEELESLLDPEKFFRISRKFIVCLDSITEIKGLVSTKLELRLHHPVAYDLSVSRDRAQDFKNWLDR